MIHRQRSLVEQLLHHEIEIHSHLYLTFILSIAMLLLSLTYSLNSSAIIHADYSPTLTVAINPPVGLSETRDIAFSQVHLLTTMDETDTNYYVIRIKITALNNSSLPLKKVRIQNSLTQGWDNTLQPEIRYVSTISPLSKNNFYDGYATSVINSANDTIHHGQEATAIIDIRVKRPTTSTPVQNLVIIQAEYNGGKIEESAVLSLDIPALPKSTEIISEHSELSG